MRPVNFNSTIFAGASTGPTINTTNSGIAYHTITWNLSPGVSAATISLDSSADGVTWTVGGVVSPQAVIANGVSTIANVIPNYIRVNVSSFTGTAGSSLTVTWDGYVNNPASAGTVAVVGPVTVVQPTGSNLHVVVDSGTITTPNASVGATGATAPTSATEVGVISNTGNLTGVSSTTPMRVDPTGTTVQPVSGTISIAAAQKVEVYDGTNTATIKAASTAAVATDTALVVTVPGSSTTGACANTAVTSVSGSVLSSNAARREVIVVNTDIVAVYLGLGQVPTATAYHVALKPCSVAHDGTGGSFVSDLFKGQVNAIVASTTGHVAVTEMT